MAKRDMMKAIANRQPRHWAYDLTWEEVDQLTNQFKTTQSRTGQENAIIEIISNSFTYGYILGERAGRAEKKRGTAKCK